MNIADISWVALGFVFLTLIIPFFVFIRYKTGLAKPLAIAILRMTGQLILVGLYLKYIFELNSIWINLGWALLMIIAASFLIISRSEIKTKPFFAPIFIAILSNVLVNGGVVALLVVGSDSFFQARYLIPISGMIIGNSLSSAIIGIRYFYNELEKQEEKYQYRIMCGATRNEALFPFMSEALKNAFSPTIANTASIGLIWLPGMMTGQILGGSSPTTAIKYQIMIVVAILAGSVLTVFVSLILSRAFVFDERDRLKKSVLAPTSLKK